MGLDLIESIIPTDDKQTISKIGDVKILYHRNIPEDAEIKTLTLIKECGKWFCSFSCDLPDLKELKILQN